MNIEIKALKQRRRRGAIAGTHHLILALMLVGGSGCDAQTQDEADDTAGLQSRKPRRDRRDRGDRGDGSLRGARDSVLGRDVLPVSVAPAKSAQLELRTALPLLFGTVTYPPTRRDDDQFADSLDLRGSLALVGAWGSGIRNKGAAHLYRLGDGSELLQSFAPQALANEDFFGFSVALGPDFLAVSALRDKEDGEPKGAVYLYERGESGAFELSAKLRPNDPQRLQEFGFSLVTAGDQLLVGAPGDRAGAGAVYVFGRDAQGEWVQTQKLSAQDAQSGDLFGASLDASEDRIAIGARGRLRNEAPVSGVAYVFVRDESGWAQEARLEPPEPSPGSRFGFSVAIDQSSVLVGAATFEVDGQPQGRVFAYERDASQGWSFRDALDPDPTLVQTPYFGSQVELAGSMALVSAYDSQDDQDLPGQVLGYVRGEQGWDAASALRVADAPVAYGFGRTLALSEQRAVVGAFLQAENDFSAEAGAFHTFEFDPASPAPLLPLWMMVGLGAGLVLRRRDG